MGQATSAYSSDFNGFRPNKNVAAQYAWLAPSAGTVYAPKPEEWRSFGTLAQLAPPPVRKRTASRSTSTSSSA